MNRPVQFLLLIAAVALLSGCSTLTTPVIAERGLDLRGMREPDGPLRAAEIIPAEPSLRDYHVTFGTGEGSIVLQAVQPTTRFGADWQLEDDGVRVEFWKIDDVGNLVMPAVIDYSDRALTYFDPPLVLVFAEMPPGEQRQSESEMRVHDSRNPERIIQRGTAVRTVEFIHVQLIRTPMGEFTARRLAVHFKASLDMAQVERSSTLFLVPGIGLVAEESNERIRMINLFDRNQQQTVVLGALRTPAAAAPAD